MSNAKPTLDEHTLSAYLANRLSAAERAAVTAALVHDPEARELLRMALHALGGIDRPPVPSAAARDADERVTRQPARQGGRRNASAESQD